VWVLASPLSGPLVVGLSFRVRRRHSHSITHRIFADEVDRQLLIVTLRPRSVVTNIKGRPNAGPCSTKNQVANLCDFFPSRKVLPSLALVARFYLGDPQTYREGMGVDIFLISVAIQNYQVGQRKTTFSSYLPGRLASSQYMVCLSTCYQYV
jgi:hypothetical protein